jgi:iron(III) transport system substrate-binding protein
MHLSRRAFGVLALGAVLGLAGAALAIGTGQPLPTAAQAGAITLYSGRSEPLVGPLIERFRRDTGIEVRARYGDSAELAAALLEEGANSPADVFFSQDAGALGAVASKAMLAALPTATLQQVDSKFRARDGSWVGVSGRARVIAYNTTMLSPIDLPDSVAGLTDPRWQGQIGWAPTNASLQASVTAMRLLDGEEAARQWLEGIKANNPKVYRNNAAVVQAVANGEVEVGLVNHYYLYGLMKEQGPSVAARNYHPRAGGAGAIVNVAGAGILSTAGNPTAAQQFVDYLLAPAAQQYFAEETYEYPLVEGVAAHPDLLPIAQINHPDVDLSNLADLEGTLRLMREVGVL